MIRRFSSRITYGRNITILLAFVLLLPGTARGQLTFAWGTVRQDTLYRTVESCLALVAKVDTRKMSADTTNYAVLPSRLRVTPNTIADTVTAVARACSQKFTIAQFLAPDSLDVPHTMNAIKLFLKAKRDADALALTDRWLAKLPASQDTLKTLIRFQVARFVLFEDMPTRFAVIQHLTDSMAFPKFWVPKILLYSLTMNRARELRDTVQYEKIATWIASTPTLLSEEQKQTEQWQSRGGLYGGEPFPPLSFYVSQAKEYLSRETILAKLRESVDSFLVFMATMNKETGIGDGSVKRETAKPIIAEYWFPEKPATPRPTVPGKIAVVYPIQGNVCSPCYYRDGFWGRIAKKFPDIEFTGLIRTMGHHGKYYGTLPADQEVRLLDSFHRKVDGFPGMLAVHQTQFWRVDDTYDRRQVEEPGPNEDQYCLMGLVCPPRVIDWEGKFINNPNLAMDPDESMELFFEALFRHKPKS